MEDKILVCEQNPHYEAEKSLKQDSTFPLGIARLWVFYVLQSICPYFKLNNTHSVSFPEIWLGSN